MRSILPALFVVCLALAACGGSSSSNDTPPPVEGDLYITSVSPDHGTLLGGTRLTIKGGGFSSGVVAILVDGVPATDVSSSSDTTANCTSPAGEYSGAVDVTVQTNVESATLPGGYRYNNPPLVLGVVPPAGFAYGQLTVSIIGLGFANNNAGPPTVYFGDTQSLAPQVVNDTLIFATTPPLPAGLVDVTVMNANGEDTLPNGFLYYGAGGVFDAKLETAPDGTTQAEVTPEGAAPQRWVWPDLLRGRAAWREIRDPENTR